MAAQVNVYVPDDLKTALEKADLPLSQLARAAWERELDRAEDAEEAGMFRVDAVDEDGVDVELRFAGKELAGGVYMTEEGKAILLHDNGTYSAWTPDEIAQYEEEFSGQVWGLAGKHDSAQVFRAFDVKPVIEL